MPSVWCTFPGFGSKISSSNSTLLAYFARGLYTTGMSFCGYLVYRVSFVWMQMCVFFPCDLDI